MNDNRDHRRIGRELALFSFREEAPGQAFWLPDGQRLRAALLDWWRGEHADHALELPGLQAFAGRFPGLRVDFQLRSAATYSAYASSPRS